MSNIIRFPVRSKKDTETPQHNDIKTFIMDELASISSNQHMNHSIIQQLENFIPVVDADFSFHIEITPENEALLEQMIPLLQEVQARFDEIIADIISERILHEMCLYRTKANQKK